MSSHVQQEATAKSKRSGHLVFAYCRIISSIDVALQLSETYRLQDFELGHVLVLYVFSIINGLIDSILDDWGSQTTYADGNGGPVGTEDSQIMHTDFEHIKIVQHGSIGTTNSIMALEVLGRLTDNQKAMVLLRLVHLNMYEFQFLTSFFLFIQIILLLQSSYMYQNHIILCFSACANSFLYKCDVIF